MSLTSCGTIPSYEQLGNGYVEATYTLLSWEPPAQRFELRYKKGWKTIVVWPDILVARVKNDEALFSGYAAYRRQQPHELRDTEPRIFIVKAPEPPLDITDEMLWRWSKENGEDFVKILGTASFVYAKETENGLEFLSATDGPGIYIYLNWNQILDVMREVKEKGVVRKDRVWGTSYIEKEFKPEVQK